MKYAERIRDYCTKHKGAMLEVSKIREGEFSDIPYKTLLKLLIFI